MLLLGVVVLLRIVTFLLGVRRRDETFSFLSFSAVFWLRDASPSGSTNWLLSLWRRLQVAVLRRYTVLGRDRLSRSCGYGSPGVGIDKVVGGGSYYRLVCYEFRFTSG
jgi:hypothetical protein